MYLIFRKHISSRYDTNIQKKDLNYPISLHCSCNIFNKKEISIYMRSKLVYYISAANETSSHTKHNLLTFVIKR